MELSSKDFCKWTLQDAADLLMDKLAENQSEGKEYSMALLHGCCDGRMFELSLVMKEVE